jgi:hypothetical protein
VVVGVAGLLALWIVIDLVIPRRGNFRDFDGVRMGQLDAAMWRSYYERRPVRLFRQLAEAHRVQFHAGFWRSIPLAYRAARAAFAFKDGRSREEYARVLPELENYFSAINALAAEPFDARAAAKSELEWWIVRREPDRFTSADWERLIAAVAGEIYRRPPETFADYARLRVEAMVLRDQRGDRITEEDWSRITSLLEQSWRALAASVS